MNQLLVKIQSVLQLCHPDDKKTIELNYYELSKIYSALKAQELYSATMEKCLMDGFDKMDGITPLIKEQKEKDREELSKCTKDDFWKCIPFGEPERHK